MIKHSLVSKSVSFLSNLLRLKITESTDVIDWRGFQIGDTVYVKAHTLGEYFGIGDILALVERDGKPYVKISIGDKTSIMTSLDRIHFRGRYV